MILTSTIVLCILSVTLEGTTEGSPLLDGVVVVEDFKSSDHLTATCPGTQNDEIDLLVSKSRTYLNFSKLVLFRPGFPCQVDELCKDITRSYRKHCSYCDYNVKESEVFASISRQFTVEAYMCHYLKTNGKQLYLVVEAATTETDVYENTTIALSCILGCVLLGVFAVLVKRRRAGQRSCNYPLVGTNLCCPCKTKTEDSVTPSDDSVIPPQRSRRDTNEDVVYVDTSFSEITTAGNVTSNQ